MAFRYPRLPLLRAFRLIPTQPLLSVQSLKQTGLKQGEVDSLFVDQKRLQKTWLSSGFSKGNGFTRCDGVAFKAKPEAPVGRQDPLDHPAISSDNGTISLDQLQADRRLMAFRQ